MLLHTIKRNPAERRKWVALLSGSLIAAALVWGRLLGAEAVEAPLMLLATLIAGGEIATRAWASLRVRHLGIEVLVTIAATGALIIGELWEAAAVTFLFALGGYLEARTLSGTRRAIQALIEVAPATAVVLRDGVQETIPAHEVRAGDTVLVRPGSKVPVDGEVIQGHAAIDESPITGESIPVEKGPGSSVYAGTVSQGGLLRVRATGVGADTTLARIIRRVEEAQEAKAPTQRFIERFAQWYTPSILGLGVVAYLITGNAALALTLLVIGCPGALVISIPVSVVAGIGRAARDGILIKGGEHLERAGKMTALALDKTGTLTEGRPRLTRVATFAPAGAVLEREAVAERGDVVERGPAVGRGEAAEAGRRELSVLDRPAAGGAASWAPAQRELLWAAAIAENGSEHPLARPVLEEAAALGAVPQPDSLETVTGRGIRARYDGSAIDVGSVRAFDEWGIPVPGEALEPIDALTSTGGTPLLVAVDGEFTGFLGVADSPRTNAAAAIDRLRKAGIRRALMLTGDGEGAARAIAERVGIDEVHASLLPEDKLDWVRRLQGEGEVVGMVGDGINDAPALAQADVGIAMGAAGTDVAIETADVALMADDLEKLPRAIAIAKKTLANMRQNVVIAIVTVLGLLAGVLTGNVHMAGGMLIHELSVLAVIVNGMRLMRA